MKITFCGAARVVTGSCYLLEHNGAKFLVDCGLFQGNKALKEKNYGSFMFNPGEIDFILLTHAHIDHSGLIPKLCKQGFKGPIYATHGTVDLAGILLPDCGHIQEMEVERKNRKALRSGATLLDPIYTAADAMECLGQLEAVDYNQSFSPAPGITVQMHDAGHILGSAMLEIDYVNDEPEKLIFTGDLGRYDHYIVKDPYPIKNADFLIMESTYGNRFHTEQDGDQERLIEIINRTFARGGNVIIPAFAVDRTQDLLLMLNMMMIEGKITPKSVYVDSPLAVKATEIFCQYPEYFDAKTTALYKKTGVCPLLLPNLNYSRTAEESIALNQIKNGAIIISASGMADAGRIKHHLKHNLWRQESSVVFTGYQAEGTLGRRLVDGEKIVRIHGEEVDVKAEIIMLEGFSAHADQSELVRWMSGFEKMPKSIFVTHGEEEASKTFAALLKNDFKANASVPSIGDCFELTRETVPVTVSEAPIEEYKIPDAKIITDIAVAISRLIANRDYQKLQQVQEYINTLTNK